MEIIELVGFLKKLASDLENGHLNQDEIRSVSEFYMQFQMLLKFKSKLNSNVDADFSQKDFLQFLALGWYIYDNLRNDDKNATFVEPQEIT